MIYENTEQMKPLNLLLLCLLTAPVCVLSQKFNLSPEGLRDASDSTKTYVVIDAPNKSAKELYKKCLAFIIETYKNPDQVIKGKVDTEYIRYEGFTPAISTGVLKAPLGKAKVNIQSKYTVEIKFKEGKIRYEVLKNNMELTDASGTFAESYGSFHIIQQGNNWKGREKLYVYDQNLNLKGEAQKRDIEGYFNNEVKALVMYLNQKTDW